MCHCALGDQALYSGTSSEAHHAQDIALLSCIEWWWWWLLCQRQLLVLQQCEDSCGAACGEQEAVQQPAQHDKPLTPALTPQIAVV